MTSLDRLWAPWRSGFVTRRQSGRCFLCTAVQSRADHQHRVIAREAQAFALLNLYPYNNGHVMVAPRRHVGRLEAIRPSEWLAILRLSQRLMSRMRRLIHPHSFNLGFNEGRDAGAGVPGHLHLHVVPRWRGDTNFMPVLSNAKVVSQSLDELYTLLTASQRTKR